MADITIAGFLPDERNRFPGELLWRTPLHGNPGCPCGVPSIPSFVIIFSVCRVLLVFPVRTPRPVIFCCKRISDDSRGCRCHPLQS